MHGDLSRVRVNNSLRIFHRIFAMQKSAARWRCILFSWRCTLFSTSSFALKMQNMSRINELCDRLRLFGCSSSPAPIERTTDRLPVAHVAGDREYRRKFSTRSSPRRQGKRDGSAPLAVPRRSAGNDRRPQAIAMTGQTVGKSALPCRSCRYIHGVKRGGPEAVQQRRFWHRSCIESFIKPAFAVV